MNVVRKQLYRNSDINFKIEILSLMIKLGAKMKMPSDYKKKKP